MIPEGLQPLRRRHRWGGLRWSLVGLLLLAWALRLPPLLRSPLHPDEALYGYWGLLIGRGQDPWLTSGPVYKPPLWPYLVSAFQLLFGDTRIALRLPGVMAGLLAVPLTGALARVLYDDAWTGASATTAAALSPFAITFSGTAFPDPLMVTWGLGACVAAARGRSRWAGLLAGLSFATKQTGLVWLPLALGLMLARGAGRGPCAQDAGLRGFLIACLAPIGLVFAWDGVRVALGGDAFWSAGVVGYGGLRLIWAHELWSRLRTWAGPMGALFASPGVHVLLLAGLPVLLLRALIQRPGPGHALFDLLLVSFPIAYVLLHWLVAFPIWSRYLLPLAPVLAVLLGRVIRVIASLESGHQQCSYRPALGALLLVLLLVLPARRASAGRSSLAEEGAPYDGIDAVISFFSELPEGSVVYHHWLGWHYHYGLFDAPVYLAYWPTPAWLARDVQAFGWRDPRYVTFPAWESSARTERALGDVGYALEPAFQVRGDRGDRAFVVYRVVQSSAP